MYVFDFGHWKAGLLRNDHSWQRIPKPWIHSRLQMGIGMVPADCNRDEWATKTRCKDNYIPNYRIINYRNLKI